MQPTTDLSHEQPHIGLYPGCRPLRPSVNGLGLKKAKAKFEADLVDFTLERCQGNVLLAAKILKTSRSMIYNLIQKYNLKVS